MRNDNKPVLGYGSQYYLSGKVGEVSQGLWYCIGLTICCTAILVGGLEHFLFFHSVGNFIPTDFHIFQRVKTTNQNYIHVICHYSAISVDRSWCFWLHEM